MRNIKSCLAYGAALCLVVISGLAYAQDDLDDVRNMTRRYLRTASYVIFPIMVGLAVAFL